MNYTIIIASIWVVIEVIVIVGLFVCKDRFKKLFPWLMCVSINIFALVFNVITIVIQP